MGCTGDEGVRTGSWTTWLLVPGNAQNDQLTRNQLHRPRGPAGTPRCQGSTLLSQQQPPRWGLLQTARAEEVSAGGKGLAQAGQGSGWTLTSHYLSAQGSWKSLTVLKEGSDFESGAGSGVRSCAPWGTMYSGGQVLGALGSHSRLAGRAAVGREHKARG